MYLEVEVEVEMEVGFDGTVELCRMVRMLDVCVMVCRVCERSAR